MTIEQMLRGLHDMAEHTTPVIPLMSTSKRLVSKPSKVKK
jgi:hypothetical protein